jgi:hypothetical protein
MFSETLTGLGTVAQAYNPSYLGGRDWEDHSSMPSWAKCSQDPHLNKWIGTVMSSSALQGSTNRRMAVQGHPDIM